jgi:hypothetical protein
MPPLAVAVIGSGETSQKNVEAQLNDFTTPYSDVTFILPADDEHWTPVVEASFDWLVENELPYVVVTTGASPSKELVPVIEGAEEVIKVARISTKMVQLLQKQAQEGEAAALLVAWNDDDPEAVTAVNKALNAEIDAFNLLDGLDKFTFDDDEGEGGDEGDEAPLPDDTVDGDQAADEDGEAPAAQIGDDYDSKGVRALRALLRERSEEHDIPDRTIGQLEKDDAIRALRNIDNGKGKAQPQEKKAESAKVSEKILADKEERTTRARRAFAEGADEGRGDEAQQSLPRSRGGDVLTDQDDDEEPVEAEVLEDAQQATTVATVDPSYLEDGLRARALELAISGGKSGAEAIADAERYVLYLRGERKSPGRPRADGTPAQPREINPETGKPVRRRGSRSTD